MNKETLLEGISKLNDDEINFLIKFLKTYGNYREVKYLNSKDEKYRAGNTYRGLRAYCVSIINKIGINGDIEERNKKIMESWDLDTDPYKPSNVVKRYLRDHGGHFTATSNKGKKYEISLLPYYKVKKDVDINEAFYCPNFQISKPYEFRIFDVVVEDLLEKGEMLKRNDVKQNCVLRTIKEKYWNIDSKDKRQIYNPTFIIAAIMNECGMVNNNEGKMSLTESYKAKLMNN